MAKQEQLEYVRHMTEDVQTEIRERRALMSGWRPGVSRDRRLVVGPAGSTYQLPKTTYLLHCFSFKLGAL